MTVCNCDRRLLIATLVLALGGLLLYLALKEIGADLRYLSIERALSAHFVKGEEINSDRLPRLIQHAQDITRNHDRARYWEGLAWLNYLAALNPDTKTALSQNDLRQAEQAFKQVLRKSPSSPQIWLRLAWVQSLLGQPPEKVTETLLMSIYTGRVERRLLLPRLELILRYTDFFQAENRQLLQDQVRMTWRYRQKPMLQYIRQGTFKTQSLWTLLGENIQLKQEIEAQL